MKTRVCLKYFVNDCSYLPQLKYMQWVSNSIPDPKIPSSNPTNVFHWTLGPSFTTRLLLVK